MRRFVIVLILFHLHYLPVLAQSQDIAIQEKGVSTDFNKGNGSVSTSVHLFDLDFGDKSIPVTLSYSSSGLRYDDVYGKFGAGWSFSLDYSLNRTIRGKLDEYSILPNIDSVETLIASGSPLNKLQKENVLLNFAVKNSINEIGLGTAGQFLKSDGTTLKNWDSESDVFSFSNFSGGGKFILLNRGSQRLDVRRVQFFDAPAGKWKIENDFHPLVPFYIYDDAGIKYDYGSLGFTNISGNSAVTSQQLDMAIHPNGDSIRMGYDDFGLNELSSNRFLSILEGCAGNGVLPRIQTRIDEIGPESDYQNLRYLTVAETKTLRINMVYTIINSRRFVSSIQVTTRQSIPRIIRTISFEYGGTGGRFTFLKKITINSNGSNKIYDFTYFNENSPTVFDRDLFGFVFANSMGDNSNVSGFPYEVNMLGIYAGEFSNFSAPWTTGNLYVLKPNLKVSDKTTISEDKTGLLKTITEPLLGRITCFDYDLNKLQAPTSLKTYYAGFRLKETYQQRQGSTLKMNHRRFYYGNIGNQETMNVNGNSGLIGEGKIINDYFGNNQVKNKYIVQKGLVLQIPTSSGNTWELLNKYEISSNYTSASSFLDLFSNNVYFDKVQEVQFDGNTPVQMKEYKFNNDNAIQNATELNLRNNQMKIVERGLINRQYRPDYLATVFVGKLPLLAQENIYELHNNTWRIRKKINYQYNTRTGAGINIGEKNQVRQLMIRDFVKLNEPFAGNDGDRINLFTKLNIDSFFDYNFYTIDFSGSILTGKDVVDYKYNN